MVNRVGSSFPKCGHSATQTELKNTICETSTKLKTGNREPQQNNRLRTGSTELLEVHVEGFNRFYGPNWTSHLD